MMTFNRFKEYFGESLQRGYRNALEDVGSEGVGTFDDWAEGEYRVYEENPDEYEVAYCGVLDA